MQEKKEKRIRRVTIKRGWYFTVGKKYGWLHEHSPEGLGINKRFFVDSDEIHISVMSPSGSKNVYVLDTQKGKEFIRKYKSFMVTPHGTEIGFVPRSLLSSKEIRIRQCKHEWVEDEMFSSGAIMIISGSPNCLGEESLVRCSKCGKEEYVPKNITEQYSILDLFNKTKKK